MDDPADNERKKRARDLVDKFNRLRKRQRHCDFVIKVGLNKLFVHRSIICANSTFFEKMLTDDTEEKQNGVAEIKEDVECTVKCVDFMYTGETSIVEDDCEQLLHVAALFELQKLCRAIGDILSKKLNANTYFSMKKLMDRYGTSTGMLYYWCNRFPSDHLVEIAEMEEFMQMGASEVNMLCFAQAGDDCSRFKAVLNWVKYDQENRACAMSALMGSVRMRNLPLSYRNYLVRFEPLVYTSASYLRSIGMSMAISMNVKPEDMDLEGNTIPLQPRDIMIFDQGTESLQSYDVIDGVWKKRQPFPRNTLCGKIRSVVLEKYLYVLVWTGEVYRIVYSDSQATWERMANKELSIGPVVLLNGTIYTSEYGKFSNRLEKFDPDENRWSLLPGKKMSLYGEALAACKGAIFSIGGMKDEKEVGSTVEKYDPSSGTWTDENPLNKARCGASTTILNDAIYVLGGSLKILPEDKEELKDVEYRCPKTKMWITIKDMPIPRYRFSSCVIDGRIYCLGGLEIETVMIEEFDPSTDDWRCIEIAKQMKIARAASVALPIQKN